MPTSLRTAKKNSHTYRKHIHIQKHTQKQTHTHAQIRSHFGSSHFFPIRLCLGILTSFEQEVSKSVVPGCVAEQSPVNSECCVNQCAPVTSTAKAGQGIVSQASRPPEQETICIEVLYIGIDMRGLCKTFCERAGRLLQHWMDRIAAIWRELPDARRAARHGGRPGFRVQRPWHSLPL